MPLKTETTRKLPLRRISTITVLFLLLGAVIMAMSRPKPVAAPQPGTALTSNAESFQAKVRQLTEPDPGGQAGQQIRLSAEEIAAAMAESGTGALKPMGISQARDVSDAQPAPETVADGEPGVEVPSVSFEGDLVKGQFVSEVAGRKVYVTCSGHLGAKGGYVTFDPTEIKVGDLSVPLSLVNHALQQKMLEQRDKLKLPDFVRDIKVENGELVVTSR